MRQECFASYYLFFHGDRIAGIKYIYAVAELQEKVWAGQAKAGKKKQNMVHNS
jgi:hypothetical protein